MVDFEAALSKASEALTLRQEVETAKRLMTALVEQRDNARNEAAIARAALHHMNTTIIGWDQLNAWSRFWSAGRIIDTLWDMVTGAL